MQKGFHEPGEKPRRFYKTVEVREGEGGFQVLLDGRSPRSTRGAPLILPTRALAELCAQEWAGQGEHIELAGMHATRLAYTALEAISAARDSTAEQITQYAGSDLICYFAETPQELVLRQTEHWGPLLEQAEQDLALVFLRVAGIRHQTQPEATLARVKALALANDDFSLAGLAFGAALFGSAILALALQRGWINGEQAHTLSRVDEAYQEEKWGVDEEAAERTARLLEEAKILERWFRALD
ncbi:MAG TPA: ATP12 family protein [Phenylobacterium sp.]|nr:ATP12 family protein [Phenylobacterium sp.]